MRTKPTKILLVDDHTIVREGLRLIFDAEEEFSDIDEAKNGKEALEMLEIVQYDLILLESRAWHALLMNSDFSRMLMAMQSAANWLFWLLTSLHSWHEFSACTKLFSSMKSNWHQYLSHCQKTSRNHLSSTSH